MTLGVRSLEAGGGNGCDTASTMILFGLREWAKLEYGVD